MEATAVYRFHIALRDVSPKVWRRVELPAGSSLADLQRVIQISLGWSDEYQHRFCVRNHYQRVTGSWGWAARRRLIAQSKNSRHLLLPRPIALFVVAPEYRPDAIVRCSPPGSGYSRIRRAMH